MASLLHLRCKDLHIKLVGSVDPLRLVVQGLLVASAEAAVHGMVAAVVLVVAEATLVALLEMNVLQLAVVVPSTMEAILWIYQATILVMAM